MKAKCLAYSAFIFTVILRLSQCDDVNRYPLLMPNVKPNVPDLYLCTPVKIDKSKDYYIIGFQPNASMDTAHHMLLYGCALPGNSEPVWNCGEMSGDLMKSSFHQAGVCGSGTQEILYAWAMDAPELTLPKDVGFKIGKSVEVDYLVLQVHYASIDSFKDGRSDDSGIILHYTERPMSKLAGVILLGTGGIVPAQKTEYMESMCKIMEDKVIHPFAYRTHTHQLGKVVAGYVIKPNNEWIQLGKRDPLTPQMFYPVNNNVTVEKNDVLAARCTMKNNLDHVVRIGSTRQDEMCNFYLMYYVESGEPLNQKFCFTDGPPYFYWKNSGLVNIPDKDASSL